MTLDPVHFDGIAELADRVDYEGEERDHREFAETVWDNYLDPLIDEKRNPILEPLDELARRRVDIAEVALEADRFETMHGLDSGTVNPRVFKNGLALDVAHAAMSSAPSDLDLHDSRTVVKAVHTPDSSRKLDRPWESYRERSKRRIVHTPYCGQYEEDAVHALALYFAESRHALDHADDVDDFLLLDGPLYPKGLLRWRDRSSELGNLFDDAEEVETVLGNYVELVERFVDRGVPLAGFVKNISAKSIVHALRKKDEGRLNPPWAHDAAFFTQLLERRERVGDRYERLTDDLTLTNWFVSRAGSDAFFGSEDADSHLDRNLGRDSYAVTFCMVYDPRRDLVYKIEAPKAFTSDDDCREKIERQILKEIAIERGPPTVISKADSLAKINPNSMQSLVQSFEESFDSELDENYNAVRWGRHY